MSKLPLFSFGLISDVQYADCDDAPNYQKTFMRCYRNSLHLLHRALERWRCDQFGVSFVLQLGDLLDGRNRRASASSESVLHMLLAQFDSLLPPHVISHHCIGNHELYNFSHNRAVDLLAPRCMGAALPASKGRAIAYYSFSPHPGFRFVSIDHYDVACIGHSINSAEYALAAEYMSVNKNAMQEDSAGLEGLWKRFVAYNGAVGKRQLAWLEQVLVDAEQDGEKVIVFGHQSILSESAAPSCLLWNYDTVCEILGRFPCVVMHFSGHEHRYWRCRDARGVHHISVPCVVETAPGSDAFGIVRMYEDGAQLDGIGELPSGWYDFGPADTVKPEDTSLGSDMCLE